MKTIQFTKMEGAGNDFIVIERPKRVDLHKLATRMCARSTGIGADGLLVLEKSKKTKFKMRIINQDGSEAEMCGNGARCMAAYISRTKSPKKKQFDMETKAGIVSAIIKPQKIKIRLSKPRHYKSDIPLSVNGRKIKVHCIDTGVPHTIVYVAGLKNIAVNTIGPKIRWHKKFQPRGTNVNFAEQIKKDLVEVRTFERGVESETRACGTGSVAVGIVTYLKTNPEIKDKVGASMNVLTASKEVLRVAFTLNNNKIDDVWLQGSAKFIAKGEYYV